jgi:coenzyme Q-binding protein COQ10
MEIFDYKRMVPYSSEQMFELISDVERYPEFLPGWQNARILEHEGNTSHVDQELGWGGFRIRFCSRVIYNRPTRIDISSTEDPFQQLSVRRVFKPADHICCIIKLRIGFKLRSTVFIHIMKPIITSRLRGIVPAFEERAYLVYSGTNRLSECINRPNAAGFH